MNNIFRKLSKLLILGCFICGCTNEIVKKRERHRMVKDAIGRNISIPDSIKTLIAINPSTLRLVCYAGGAKLVSGIEDVEIQGSAFTHIFANKELLNLPIIGSKDGGDVELIIENNPDIIITSNMGAVSANELQEKTGIPVFVITYGDMGMSRDDTYNSLRILGNLLNTQAHVDSLINFIEGEISQIKSLSAKICNNNSTAYLGGLSYKGRHNILSTDPFYAPFEMINANNAAIQLRKNKIAGISNATIDFEILLDWNPNVVFIDQGGLGLVKNDFTTYTPLCKLLKSYRDKNIYMIWPYYMYHSNFEVMLINAWYIGKVLYNKEFGEVDIEKKTMEILKMFVGKDVTSELKEKWGWFRNITDELNN